MFSHISPEQRVPADHPSRKRSSAANRLLDVGCDYGLLKRSAFESANRRQVHGTEGARRVARLGSNGP
jgi:hypothetical protein